MDAAATECVWALYAATEQNIHRQTEVDIAGRNKKIDIGKTTQKHINSDINSMPNKHKTHKFI